MVKLDFDLERDVPELKGKVLLITGGKHSQNHAGQILPSQEQP